MKITKQTSPRKNPKKVWAILIPIAFIVIALAIYLIPLKGSFFGWQPFGTKSNIQPVKSSPIDSSDTNTETKGEGSTQTTDQVPINTALTATITDLSQSNGYINFSATTSDTKSGGRCSVTFSNPNDRPISRTSDAVLSNGFETCGPIQISEDEFSYLGNWTATFRYYTNNTQVVVEKNITIK